MTDVPNLPFHNVPSIAGSQVSRVTIQVQPRKYEQDWQQIATPRQNDPSDDFTNFDQPSMSKNLGGINTSPRQRNKHGQSSKSSGMSARNSSELRHSSGLAFPGDDVMRSFVDDVENMATDTERRNLKTRLNLGSSPSDNTDVQKLKSTTRCNKGCLIAVSCVVAILLAGLVATVTLLLLGPCYRVHCVHGYCDWTGATMSNPICLCEEHWTGNICDKEIQVTQHTNTTGLTFSWDHVVDESSRGWKLMYSEARNFPDEQSKYTNENFTTFKDIKPLETYEMQVFSIDWNHQMMLVHLERRRVMDSELTSFWQNTSGSDRGFFVKVNRIRKRQTETIFLEKDQTEASLEDLDKCTTYRVHVYKVNADLTENQVAGFVQETDCPTEASGWHVGDSIILGDWSGGGDRLLTTSHCRQKDFYPFPVHNPSCRSDESAGSVGESISNETAHTGSQSWHYKRGHRKTNHGKGCPYSPQLPLKSGRSDSGYQGDVDGFYARIWIKAANASGDGSSIELAGGDEFGTDRVSTMVFVTADSSGMHMNTYDSNWETCIPNKNCSVSGEYFPVPLATNLSLSEWHLLEMELKATPSDYGDRWTYSVDEAAVYEVGAYLNAWTQEHIDTYKYVNRLKFKPRNDDVDDVTKLGFFFDDIRYEAFSWDHRDNILATYETSFES